MDKLRATEGIHIPRDPSWGAPRPTPSQTPQPCPCLTTSICMLGSPHPHYHASPSPPQVLSHFPLPYELSCQPAPWWGLPQAPRAPGGHGSQSQQLGLLPIDSPARGSDADLRFPSMPSCCLDLLGAAPLPSLPLSGPPPLSLLACPRIHFWGAQPPGHWPRQFWTTTSSLWGDTQPLLQEHPQMAHTCLPGVSCPGHWHLPWPEHHCVGNPARWSKLALMQWRAQPWWREVVLPSEAPSHMPTFYRKGTDKRQETVGSPWAGPASPASLGSQTSQKLLSTGGSRPWTAAHERRGMQLPVRPCVGRWAWSLSLQ